MSFLIILLYLVSTFIRPQDWVPGMYNWPIVYWLAIAAIVFLVIERFAIKKNVFVHVPQNGLMLGLFLTVLMSHVVHTYFGGLTKAFEEFSVLFILFFVLLHGINTESKFKISIWFIIAMILLFVPQGIYQIQHGYGWGGQELTHDFQRNEDRINWIGIFNDPNDLALIFTVAIGMILAFLFGKAGLLQRLFAIPAIAALLYGMFLTNSRGGYVALMVTAFFFFVRRTRKFVIGGIIGIIAVAGILAVGPSRLGIISIEEDSAANRVELWYQGILMLKSNPIFGVGFRMFEEDTPQTAHNSFILAAAELGIVGLFFWMGLIYTSYKGLTIIQKSNERLKTYALGLQSGLIGFCGAAFFLSRTYVILPYLLFALSGALMQIAKQSDEKLDFHLNKKDFGIIAGWSLGILLLTYVVIKIGL